MENEKKHLISVIGDYIATEKDTVKKTRLENYLASFVEGKKTIRGANCLLSRLGNQDHLDAITGATHK